MRKSFIGRAVIALSAAGAALALLRAEDPPAVPPDHADHAEHGTVAGEATNPEPPKPEKFLFLGSEPKTVRLVLIASYNAANYGMNFDGFSKGGAKCVVPLGWNVEVAFTNRSAVPHSAVVVERAMAKRVQMGDPAFEGASTTQPLRGTTGSKGETFRFKASEAGDYAIACGFPAHAANGHWIALEVSDTAKEPSLQFGKADAYTPK